MTKKEKIEKWLIDQGYGTQERVTAAYSIPNKDYICSTNFFKAKELATDKKCSVVGIFKGTEYIKIPEFDDDEQVKEDMFLMEYLNSGLVDYQESQAWVETNRRMKALEEIVKQQERRFSDLEEELDKAYELIKEHEKKFILLGYKGNLTEMQFEARKHQHKILE